MFRFERWEKELLNEINYAIACVKTSIYIELSRQKYNAILRKWFSPQLRGTSNLYVLIAKREKYEISNQNIT